MTVKFTRERREEIVREFAIRHNGTFNPTLFVQEVRAHGEAHPAYAWFEWDRDRAFDQHQIEQAREFARDLRVRFSIEEVGRRRAVTVRETAMPMVLSPVHNRSHGGGYFLADPDNPDHMAEHYRQAATALQSWCDRYQAVVQSLGLEGLAIPRMVERIKAKAPPAADAA